MTQLQKFEANLTDAKAKAVAAQAALVANPENRDLAIDKLQADAAVTNTEQALRAERDRLAAKHRAALEQERDRLLAEIEATDAAMVSEEVELRTQLARLYAERERRFADLEAKSNRVTAINKELATGRVAPNRGPVIPTSRHHIHAEVRSRLVDAITDLQQQIAPTSQSFHYHVSNFALPKG